MINWKNLTDAAQLDIIASESNLKPVVIFKHSTTCSISKMSKMRLEESWDLDIDAYYLDLLNYRPISSQIAEKFSVHHESPQLLLIDKGECIYDASHFDIKVEEIKEALAYQEKTH